MVMWQWEMEWRLNSSAGKAQLWESCVSFSSVEDGQFWGKSPLNWIFREVRTMGGAVISMALQHLYFCMHSPTVTVAATEKIVILTLYWQCWTTWTQHQLSHRQSVTLWMGVALLRSHLLPHMWSNYVKLKAWRAEWGVMNSCLFLKSI